MISVKQRLLALASLLGIQVFLLAPIALSAPGTTIPSGVPTEFPTIVTTDVPDTVLTVTGCASPNAFVTFFDDNDPVGTVIANSAGRFTKKIVVPNRQAGLHNIKIYYDDINGRTSSTVTQNISLAAQSNTNLNLLLPTTVEHEPEPLVIGDYLVFRGSTCPFSVVNVIINNNFTLAAQADDRGNWYVIADSDNFYNGKHIYEALTSLNNDVSQKTHKYQFTTIGQGSGGSGGRTELTTPTITEPSDGYLTSTRAVTVRGVGPTNTQIEIFVDNFMSGSIFTNAIGEWSFNLHMQKPQHTVAVRACNNGECSEMSNQVRIYFNGDLQTCSLTYSLGNYRFYGVEPNEGIDLYLKDVIGRPAYTILVDWGDASIEHLTVLDDNPVRFHHIYKHSGKYNGIFTLKDSYGCTQVQYFSVSVGSDDAASWWLLAFIPIGAILSIAVSRYVTANKNRITKEVEPKPILPPIQHFPKPVLGAEEEPKSDDEDS